MIKMKEEVLIPEGKEQFHSRFDTGEIATSLPQIPKKRSLKDMMIAFEILSPPVSLREINAVQKL